MKPTASTVMVMVLGLIGLALFGLSFLSGQAHAKTISIAANPCVIVEPDCSTLTLAENARITSRLNPNGNALTTCQGRLPANTPPPATAITCDYANSGGIYCWSL